MLSYGREAYVMSNFNVIFEGIISNGYKVEDVKRNLAALFKIDGKKVDLLFRTTCGFLKRRSTFQNNLWFFEK